MKTAVRLFACLLLVACGQSSDKPLYPLPADSRLHLYQPGDRLSYQLFGDSNAQSLFGQLVADFETSSLAQDPDGNSVSLLKQTLTLSIDGRASQREIRHMGQDGDGYLRLYAVEHGTELLWFRESGQSAYGLRWLPSPLADLSQISQGFSIGFDIDACDTTCQSAGSGTLQWFPGAIQTVNTAYAKFESYRLDTLFSLSFANPAYDDALPVASEQSDLWLYPSLGVVEARLQRTDPDSFEIDSYTVTLQTTTIDLPDPP